MKKVILSHIIKPFFLILFIPFLNFGQILHSNNFPFQSITSTENYSKLYELLLQQGLFIDLELDQYVLNHKTIALLPINFKYTSQKNELSTEEVEKFESKISKFIYDRFISDLQSYSSKYIEIENSINSENSNHNNDSYIPQTQKNRYLEHLKYQTATKKNINLKDSVEVFETLENINVISYSPEFFCEHLGVDALLFISIYSDIFIPFEQSSSLRFDKRDNNTQLFISMYDHSGKLLWLYAKNLSSNRLFSDNGDLSDFYSNENHLFSNIFDDFPYLYHLK